MPDESEILDPQDVEDLCDWEAEYRAQIVADKLDEKEKEDSDDTVR